MQQCYNIWFHFAIQIYILHPARATVMLQEEDLQSWAQRNCWRAEKSPDVTMQAEQGKKDCSRRSEADLHEDATVAKRRFPLASEMIGCSLLSLWTTKKKGPVRADTRGSGKNYFQPSFCLIYLIQHIDFYPTWQGNFAYLLCSYLVIYKTEL